VRCVRIETRTPHFHDNKGEGLPASPPIDRDKIPAG
jgi:hypothetical protein